MTDCALRPTISPTIERLLFGSLLAGIVALALGGLGGSFQLSRLIALGALGTLTITTRNVVIPRRIRIVYVVYAAILLLGAVTLPLSSNVASGMSLLVTVAIGMSALLLVRRHVTVENARRVRDAWVVSLLVTLPFACYELLTGAHFSFAYEGRNVGRGFGELPFASVFFGNYNNYSTFICLAYPMLLSALMDQSSRGRRTVLLLATAVTVAVTLINTSRIAVAFVLFATACMLFVDFKGRKRFLLVLLAGVLAMVRLTGFDVNYLQLRLAVDVISGESTSERVSIVKAALGSLRETFGVGLGPGGFFGYAERVHPHLIPNPHNLLVELAVNFTIVSAALFAALLLMLLRWSWRNPFLSRSLKFPMLVTLPFVPLIGSINSLAVGYTYWWYWLASAVFIAVAVPSDILLTSPPWPSGGEEIRDS